MAWTKAQIIDEAFSELALGSTFDMEPEERETALRRLDTMMATWEAKGVRVGYNGPGLLASDSGIPLSAVETVYLNLAVRIAGGFGKQVSALTLTTARAGYDTLLIAAAMPPEQQLPSMPRGAGQRVGTYSLGGSFSPAPDQNPLQTTPGGDLHIDTD